MAYAEFLPDDALESIAEQIGTHLPYVAEPPLLTQAVEMGETFTLWMLGAEAIASAACTSSDLAQLARPTARWHHQIKHAGKAASFARSAKRDAINYSVRELFVSLLAESIDQAIDWVDQNISQEMLVRLLIVPAYHVHAFWLVSKAGDDDQVLVIDSPARFTHLSPKQLFSSREFLEALLREQPGIGIQP